MITRFALRELGAREHPLVVPSGCGDLICIGCYQTFDVDGVIISDNGPVCMNCLKALADSYFDPPPSTASTA